MPANKTILQHNTTSMMLLRYHSFATPRLDLLSVKKELLEHLRMKGDGASHTWGYFPELKPEKKDYPCSIELLDRLRKLYDPEITLKPAFVRIATQEPQSDFGGLHIDLSPGVSHIKDYDAGEILRVLINIGEVPRTLNFSPLGLDQLEEKQHIAISRTHYQIIKLPGTELTSIEIPPLDKHGFFSLEFISSQIVHAGITTAEGHFLASFGGVNSQKTIQTFFEQ